MSLGAMEDEVEELDVVRRERDEATEKYKTLQLECSALKARTEDLPRIRDLYKERTQLRKNAALASERCEKAEVKASELEEKLAAANLALKTQRGQQCLSATQREAYLSKQVEETQQLLDAAREEFQETLRLERERNSELSNECELRRQALGKAASTATDLERQFLELQSQRKKKKKTEERVEVDRRVVDEKLRTEQERSDKLSEQLHITAGKAADLEEQLLEMQNQRDHAQQQMQELQDAVQTKQTQADEKVEAERRVVEKKLRTEQDRANKLSEQLHKTKGKAADLERQLLDVQGQRDKLSEQLHKTADKAADLERQSLEIQSLRDTAEQQTQELLEIQSQRDKLSEQLHKATGKATDLERQCLEMQSQRDTAEQQKQELQEAVQTERRQAEKRIEAERRVAEEKLATEKERTTRLGEQLEDLQRQLQQQHVDNGDKDSRSKQCPPRNGSQAERGAKLSHLLHDLQEERDALEGQVNLLQDKCSRLQRCLDRAETEGSLELRAALERERQRVHHLECKLLEHIGRKENRREGVHDFALELGKRLQQMVLDAPAESKQNVKKRLLLCFHPDRNPAVELATVATRFLNDINN